MLPLDSLQLSDVEEYTSHPYLFEFTMDEFEAASESLDFELCFTEHEDASAWSGVSLQELDFECFPEKEWEDHLDKPDLVDSEYGISDLITDIIIAGVKYVLMFGK